MATGKGFSGKRSDTFVYDADDLVIVGLDTDDGPEHPLYDVRIKLPIDDGNVRSIIGTVDRPGKVYTPILIEKYEGKSKAHLGRPCVIDGRQRVRAAREAKKVGKAEGREVNTKIECKAQRIDELGAFLMALTVNALRQDDDMMVKAEKAAEARDRGAKVEEIAIAFGVTAKAIEQWFALHDGATAPLKKAVRDGAISPTAAAKLATLDGKDAQEEALAEVMASGNTSAKAAKKAAAKRKDKSGEGSDGVGVGKKIQKRLLEYATGTPGDEPDPYWVGARDILRVVLGEKSTAVAGKLKTALKKCGAEVE